MNGYKGLRKALVVKSRQIYCLLSPLDYLDLRNLDLS